MSARSEEPSWRLPDQAEAGPERRRVKPVHALVASLVALALLCCGGAAALGAFTGGGGKQPGAAAGTSQPSASPETGISDATEKATPAIKKATTAAKPRATSSRPKPKPTTRKPTPTTPAPTTRTPSPAPTPTTTAPPGPIVRAGAFCAPEGAIGYTAKGKKMRCTRRDGEARARWRAA